jgi:hypothetical protein
VSKESDDDIDIDSLIAGDCNTGIAGSWRRRQG